MKRYLTEVIGTCFLTLAIAGIGEAMAVGAMLIAIMYMCHDGTYNPAVAVGAVMSKFLDKDHLVGVIFAQIIGACIGLCLIWVWSNKIWMPQTMLLSPWSLILLEAVMMFLFTLVYLVMEEKHRDYKAHVYGLAIGIAFMAIWFFGGLYNPAVLIASFICALVKGMLTKELVMAMMACLIGPFIGAIVAAWGYDRFHRKEML